MSIRRILLGVWLVASGLSLLISGCGKGPAPAVTQPAPDADVAKDNDGNATQNPIVQNPSTPIVVNYTQGFADAAITEVLEGHHLPPDVTIGGKKSGLLRALIEDSLSNLKLLDTVGKPIPYALHVTASERSFEIN